MQIENKAIPPVVLVVAAVLLWSTGGLFIKLTTLDAYQVTFFRSLLAGITVLLVTRKAGLRINVFGLMCSVIYATLLFLFVWATKHTTAANAIFLQYTAPIYILILSPFIIGEKFHWRDLATIIFCIGGMSLFFVGKLEISDYQGNIAALGSGIFLGLYIMLLKHPKAAGDGQSTVGDQGRRLQNETSEQLTVRNAGSATADSASKITILFTKGAQVSETILPASAADIQNQSLKTHHSSPVATHSRLNPVITVIYGNVLLALVTLPSGISAISTTVTGLAAKTIPVSEPLTNFGAVAFLGIIQIGLAYILFIKGVTGGTRPLDASIIGFIEPLLNPVWVFIFVGERPSQWAILGGIIIIATVCVHTVVQYRNRPVTT